MKIYNTKGSIRRMEYSYKEDVADWEARHGNKIMKCNNRWYVFRDGKLVKQ
jgi:hypothetical protein